MRSGLLCGLAVALVAVPLAGAPTGPLGDDAVRALLRDELADAGERGAIVAALIDPNGTRFVSVGESDNPARAVVDEDTIFEIGSITKTFTAVLLADAVARGELSFDDRLDRWLADRTGTRDDGAGAATLRELATHTSGLPRLPLDFWIMSRLVLSIRDPYRDVRESDVNAWLARYRRPETRGFEYSNVGFGLLANAIERATGKPYATLIGDRIAGPLGLTSTFVTVPRTESARIAVGHDPAGDPTRPWSAGPFYGAGVIRSTARDVATYVVAHRDGRTPASGAMFEPRAKTPGGREIGLAWIVDQSIVWHNGGTGGFFSFVGLKRASGQGVVLLSSTGRDVTDLGFQLLGAPEPRSGRAASVAIVACAALAPIAAAIRGATRGGSAPTWLPRWMKWRPDWVTRRTKPPSRVESMLRVLGSATSLAICWHIAAWGSVVGHGARLAVATLTAILSVLALWRARRFPWTNGTGMQWANEIFAFALLAALLYVAVARW